jgi:hypothetical protein
MGTEAMKLELIEWLAKLDDPGMLASLFNLKKASETEDWFKDLSPEHRASLERGLEQARNGQVMSSEDLWRSYGRSKQG